MESHIKIRKAEDSDKSQILRLLNNVFKEQQLVNIERDSDYWNWKFKQNPFGESILTVAEAEGEIIGFDHLWPWEFILKDEIYKAAQPCDLAVRKDYRGKGMFKKMRLFSIQSARRDGVQFLFNFPNKNSLQGNKSLGAVYLGEILWQVKVLKPFNVLKSYFSEIKSERVEIPPEYMISPDELNTLELISSCENEFISIRRIKGFYRWRYSDKPKRSYGMVTVKKKNKSAAAFFTLNQRNGCRDLVWVDFVGSNELAGPLADRIIETGRDLNADLILLMNNHCFNTQRLWKKGFLRKREKNMVVFPLTDNPQIKIDNFKYWSLMASLHDSI